MQDDDEGYSRIFRRARRYSTRLLMLTVSTSSAGSLSTASRQSAM
jgi:hypothetical protein